MSHVGDALLAPGAVFHGRYEVVRCIRAGGMGAVYEVIHGETRRRRALKTMLPSLVQDSDLKARFRAEATVTAEIESEHIVEVFDAGVDPATSIPFLVMELLKGDDLGELIARRGALPREEVVTLLWQAAMALDRTHAAGIVHRDLKPENLFLTRRDDGAPRLKVLDFGIAKVVAQSTQAKTTRSVGTPLYMSPEQIRGDGTIDARADLYALGHIAYALLAGEAYWEQEARASESVYPLLMRVIQGSAEPPSERAARRGVQLPPGVDAWFRRAVHPEPGRRFDSAGELVEELARALGVLLPRPGLVSVPDRGASEAVPGAAPSGTRVSAGAGRAPAAVGPTGPTGSVTGAAVSSDRRAGLPGRSLVPLAAGFALVLVAGAALLAWNARLGTVEPDGSAQTASQPHQAARSAAAPSTQPLQVEPAVEPASAGPAGAGSQATSAAPPAVRAPSAAQRGDARARRSAPRATPSATATPVASAERESPPQPLPPQTVPPKRYDPTDVR